MDKVCTICFEEMDMLSYQDEQDSTLHCFKLECGHAYHTRCIVDCLQRVNKKCPNCNIDKPPEQVLRMEGVVSKLLDEAKRSKDLRDAFQNYRTTLNALKDTVRELKNDTRDFIKTRKEELCIQQKRKDFNSSLRKVRFKFLKICREKGPIYYGAYKNIPDWRRDRLLFSNRHRHYRLKHSYFHLKL